MLSNGERILRQILVSSAYKTMSVPSDKSSEISLIKVQKKLKVFEENWDS